MTKHDIIKHLRSEADRAERSARCAPETATRSDQSKIMVHLRGIIETLEIADPSLKRKG